MNVAEAVPLFIGSLGIALIIYGIVKKSRPMMERPIELAVELTEKRFEVPEKMEVSLIPRSALSSGSSGDSTDGFMVTSSEKYLEKLREVVGKRRLKRLEEESKIVTPESEIVKMRVSDVLKAAVPAIVVTIVVPALWTLDWVYPIPVTVKSDIWLLGLLLLFAVAVMKHILPKPYKLPEIQMPMPSRKATEERMRRIVEVSRRMFATAKKIAEYTYVKLNEIPIVRRIIRRIQNLKLFT